MKKKVVPLPPIYENWIEFNKRKKQDIEHIFEYPLFSDAYIIGENQTDFGPYEFLNPCPEHTYSQTKIVLFVRINGCLDNNDFPEMNKTDTTCYHGGDLVDEISALTSLLLGIRIKPGGKTREFNLRCKDTLGRPIEWEKRPVLNMLPEHNRYKMPSVLGKRSIVQLDLLKSFINLSIDNVITLIKVARLYQDALWISEREPSLAWIMLVSAIETAANQWKKSRESPEERLQTSKPELYEYLVSTNVANIITNVASKISDSLGSSRKFIDFVLEYLPKAPEKRPPEWVQHSWKNSDMKKSMKLIYSYRSQALHDGTPFPYPMCESPYYAKEFEAPAEKPIGLGCSANTGIWTIKDTPMLLNTFEYIARNCLLNWWNSLNKNS